MGSAWSCFSVGEVVLPIVGYMGSTRCTAYIEGRYEVCNASMQPLPNTYEKRQEINLLFYN